VRATLWALLPRRDRAECGILLIIFVNNTSKNTTKPRCRWCSGPRRRWPTPARGSLRTRCIAWTAIFRWSLPGKMRRCAVECLVRWGKRLENHRMSISWRHYFVLFSQLDIWVFIILVYLFIEIKLKTPSDEANVLESDSKVSKFLIRQSFYGRCVDYPEILMKNSIILIHILCFSLFRSK
jgi:hypothetical protein